MATKTFLTNLKLITAALSAPPTTVQLPLGNAAFGIVNGRLSMWGNCDNTVRDIVLEGCLKTEILNALGTSTTAGISQNAATVAINARESTANKNKASGYAGLDANGKVLPAQLPDFVLSKLLFGGTVNKAGLATLSASFKSKYSIATATVQLTAGAATSYEGAFFIAQDTAEFTDQTILGVTGVSTGDWVMSNGASWVKVDNTDAVVSVNGKAGAVTITLTELGGLSTTGNASSVTSIFSQAATRANLTSGETLATSLSKLMKWYADLAAGLAFQTAVTSAQMPVATNAARGAVIVPTASAISVDASGNLAVKIGDGIKQNASNALEADIIVTYGVI